MKDWNSLRAFLQVNLEDRKEHISIADARAIIDIVPRRYQEMVRSFTFLCMGLICVGYMADMFLLMSEYFDVL